MQPPKLMRFVFALFAVFAAFALSSAIGFAQTPTLLSASGSPLVFELPASQKLTSALAPTTTAKLATPAQHAERGLAYPLWLSDANFSVRSRPGQRQSVVVEAKRGNPELTTDLLLALNNKGVRTLEPSTLIFDKLSTFAAALPMPPANQAVQPDLASGFADLRKTTAPIQFTDTPQGTPIAPIAPTIHANTNVSKPPSTHINVTNPDQNAPVAAKVSKVAKPTSPATLANAPVARSPQAVTFPTESASQAMPDKASKTPSPAALIPSGLPAQPKNPSVAKPNKTPEPSWLDDWPLLAGAALALILLAYLATRLLKNHAESRATPTKFAPTEQVANTVFGLSAEEADAMHKKWLREQILQKSNN